MNIEDKVDEVVGYFLTSYFELAEDRQKERINALSLYVNDIIYSLYEDIDQEEFHNVYDRVMAELEDALKEDIDKWVIW